ncbi:hypothetical protein MMAGJ_51550 [Mycolicibacterium mageritense]|uniref:Uncharacterized protein n=1 Tax=Mycolicibacterium mageritense TaxID=53462 RepID=A0ABM7HZ35_MYCME|nr:hypothetical protein MMAGJ_51550 [Mycolicibacterium mageritense]GJJ17556.1 hypothetical protein MTY414_12290 [Mycolicibacterium mageritense]
MYYSRNSRPRPRAPSDGPETSVERSDGMATGKVDGDNIRRHARIGAVQAVADGRFAEIGPRREDCLSSNDIDGGARSGKATDR